MDAVYQATFFLALTLLAVLVPVFVFAVSFLGRAIERAREEEESIRGEHERKKKQEIAEAQSALEQASTKGGSVQQAKERVDNLLDEEERYDEETKQVRKGFIRLTVKGAVIYPGFLLLVTLVLAIFARYLENLSPSNAPLLVIGLFIWGGGLVALFFSLKAILGTLLSIQKVALTSEAAYFARMKDALMGALIEQEEARLPVLVLRFAANVPLTFAPEDSRKIGFRVALKRGPVGKETTIYFFTPPEFDFPGQKSYFQSQDRGNIAGYRTRIIELGNVRQGIENIGSVTIKAAMKPGKYTLYYKIVCDGFDSEMQPTQCSISQTAEPLPRSTGA